MPGEILLALALMVLGFILLFVEAAIIPGVGIVGVLGFGTAAAGVYLLWQSAGAAVGIAGMLGSIALTGLAVWRFAKSRAGQALTLTDRVSGTAVGAERFAPLVGKRGTALGPLRPSGIIEVEGQRVDAVAGDGAFVSPGTAVRVVGHEHGQLVVEALEAGEG